jgi:cell division protein FtsL
MNFEQYFIDEMIRQTGIFVQKDDVLVSKSGKLCRIEKVIVETFVLGEAPVFHIRYIYKNQERTNTFKDMVSSIKMNLGKISDSDLKDQYPEFFI